MTIKRKQKKSKQLTQRKKKKLLQTIRTTVSPIAFTTSTPTPMAININSSTDVLLTAYPITVLWDNDEDCFMIELSAFNQEFHATTDWNQSVNFAKLVQRLLIETYRSSGLTLPEVG